MPLRLVGIACIGNEADIVEPFVRWHTALLDHLVVLEHNSLDGTREILDRLVDEGLRISVEHVSDGRFFQVAYTNRLYRVAAEAHGADWVFPLDCDEFLVVRSRADLETALRLAGEAHARMPWITYVPTAADDPLERHPLRRIQHCYDLPTPGVDDNPWVWKVAVNVPFLGDYHLDRYEICQGNHFLSMPGQGHPVDAPMPPLHGASLAHFPFRSVEQASVKVALGLLSRLGTPGQSSYYGKLWQAFTAGPVGTDALASAARHFLDPGRFTAEDLKDTPVKLAPLAADAPLIHAGKGLPAVAVILQWVEQNLLGAEQRRDALLRAGGTVA